MKVKLVGLPDEGKIIECPYHVGMNLIKQGQAVDVTPEPMPTVLQQIARAQAKADEGDVENKDAGAAPRNKRGGRDKAKTRKGGRKR